MGNRGRYFRPVPGKAFCSCPFRGENGGLFLFAFSSSHCREKYPAKIHGAKIPGVETFRTGTAFLSNNSVAGLLARIFQG